MIVVGWQYSHLIREFFVLGLVKTNLLRCFINRYLQVKRRKSIAEAEQMNLGISLLPNFLDISSIESFFNFAQEMAVQTVELITEPPWCCLAELSPEKRKHIEDLAKERGLSLTVHSCFSDINIAALNPTIRSACLDIVKSSIAFSAEIGAKVVTIHPGAFGANGIAFPEKTKIYNFKAVQELAAFSAKKKIQLGYENFPIVPWQLFDESFKPKEIQEFVERINNNALGITWDVGHSNTTNIPMEEFFKHFKNHLVNIHLHDNKGGGEGWLDQHLAVGEGTTPWEKFFDLMSTIDYQKALILELNSKKKIISSIDYLQRFL
ncbi:MAG: sugar phosphate isomerase/epimerase family protein [Candidatus Heimdallarchaeota archaeon]